MAVPISPRDVGLLLTCGAMLPLAAFLGAYPTEKGKRKTINILGFIIGVIAITGVGIMMYQYR